MEKIMIIGNIGNNAELKKLEKINIVSFSVACSQKVKGEQKTNWYRVTMFDTEIPKILDSLTKGTKVFVEGMPKINSYKNKDGETISNIEIIFPRIEFCSSKSENKPESEKEPENEPENEPIEKDDIPF